MFILITITSEFLSLIIPFEMRKNLISHILYMCCLPNYGSLAYSLELAREHSSFLHQQERHLRLPYYAVFAVVVLLIQQENSKILIC